MKLSVNMSQPYGRKSTHDHFQRTHNHFKVISNITVTFLLFAKSKNMRFVPAFCTGMILFASLLFGVGGSDTVRKAPQINPADNSFTAQPLGNCIGWGCAVKRLSAPRAVAAV